MHWRNRDTDDHAIASKASKSEQIHTFWLKLVNQSKDGEMQLFTRDFFRSSTLWYSTHRDTLLGTV